MTARPPPDFRSRTPEALARFFEHFGEVECPPLGARLYQELCRGIARDAELLQVAGHAPPTQPPPNLLFASVHYLLLGSERHPLRGFYPALADGAAGEPEAAFPAFRDFCLRHRERIEHLVATRLTQTNVVQRCSVLLPAFARVFAAGGGRPLALVEIGASAGLNLQWSRFRYAYRRGGEPVASWGEAGDAPLVECELWGRGGLPALPADIPVASRLGLDVHPIDVGDADAVQWLRALIWPEHVERQERLGRAIAVARRDPPTMLEGDASRALPDALARAPEDATLCVYATHTLYQFPRDALRTTLKAMQAAGRRRPLAFVSYEGTGDGSSELHLTHYEGGGRDTRLLARCSPHGRWLEWLADTDGARG